MSDILFYTEDSEEFINAFGLAEELKDDNMFINELYLFMNKYKKVSEKQLCCIYEAELEKYDDEPGPMYY